jgi:hypothetical protein
MRFLVKERKKKEKAIAGLRERIPELKADIYGERHMYQQMVWIVETTPALRVANTRLNRSILFAAVKEMRTFHKAIMMGTRQLTEGTRSIVFEYARFTPLQYPTRYAQLRRFVKLLCSETKKFYNGVCQIPRYFDHNTICDCSIMPQTSPRIPVKRKRGER